MYAKLYRLPYYKIHAQPNDGDAEREYIKKTRAVEFNSFGERALERVYFSNAQDNRLLSYCTKGCFCGMLFVLFSFEEFLLAPINYHFPPAATTAADSNI